MYMLEPLTIYQVTNECAKIPQMLGCTAFNKMDAGFPQSWKNSEIRHFKIVSSWPGFFFFLALYYLENFKSQEKSLPIYSTLRQEPTLSRLYVKVHNMEFTKTRALK